MDALPLPFKKCETHNHAGDVFLWWEIFIDFVLAEILAKGHGHLRAWLYYDGKFIKEAWIELNWKEGLGCAITLHSSNQSNTKILFNENICSFLWISIFFGNEMEILFLQKRHAKRVNTHGCPQMFKFPIFTLQCTCCVKFIIHHHKFQSVSQGLLNNILQSSC